MLALKQARQIAIEQIAKTVGDSDAFRIIDSETMVRPYGWVFFYQSRRYLESGDELEMIAGNAPLIVNRFTGAVTVTGTANPIGHYLAEYELHLPPSAA